MKDEVNHKVSYFEEVLCVLIDYIHFTIWLVFYFIDHEKYEEEK